MVFLEEVQEIKTTAGANKQKNKFDFIFLFKI
jgi:hypothetical protein